MLVLTLKEGRSFELAIPPSNEWRTVRCTVIGFDGSKIKAGIEAPIEIGVSRPDKHGAVQLPKAG